MAYDLKPLKKYPSSLERRTDPAFLEARPVVFEKPKTEKPSEGPVMKLILLVIAYTKNVWTDPPKPPSIARHPPR